MFSATQLRRFFSTHKHTHERVNRKLQLFSFLFFTPPFSSGEIDYFLQKRVLKNLR